MQRMGMVIGIAPEDIAEYKRLHADAWPEVLERVLDGMSNKEIAGQLFLSEQGVKMHLGRLFRKFGVANRAQLILIAFRRVCPFNHNLVDYLRQAREERGTVRH